MAGKKVGQPTKLTPAVQEKIVQVIRAGNYAVVAAQYAGIGSSTFYLWLERGAAEKSGIYLEFLEAVKAAEAHAEVRAVALVQKHMDENWQAAMTYLERKFSERWSRREKVDVGSHDGGPLTMVTEVVVHLEREGGESDSE